MRAGISWFAGRVSTLVVWLLRSVLPTLLLVMVFSFALLQLAPGDAADMAAAQAGDASLETLQSLRNEYGLDRSVMAQFRDYALGVVQLDFGDSLRYGVPVMQLILLYWPPTLLLILSSCLLALVLGVSMGVASAYWRGTWLSDLLTWITALLYSAPGFVVGLGLIIVFSVHLGWFPGSGQVSVSRVLAGQSGWLDRVHHLVLPAFALSTFSLAGYARLTFNALQELETQDFVRTAAGKGLSRGRILLRHVLRNAWLPISSMAGNNLGGLIAGSALIEGVFNWPGLGRLTLEAAQARDYPLLMGVVLLAACLVIVINASVDHLQSLIDPRIGRRNG